MRRIDQSGNPNGGELVLDTNIVQDHAIDVVALNSGGFAVVWENRPDNAPSTFGTEIKGQIFDSSGNAVPGGAFVASGGLDANHVRPAISQLSNGNLAVVWQSLSNSDFDGDNFGTVGQIIGVDGQLVGSRFALNTSTNSHQGDVDVAALAGGGFFATWQDGSFQADAPFVVTTRGQLFANDGHMIGSEQLISPDIYGRQDNPAISVLSTGDLVVAFSDGVSGDSNVSAQILCLDYLLV